MADKAVAKASILMLYNSKNFNKGIDESRKKWEGFTSKLDDINKKTFNNSSFGQGLVKGLNKFTPAVTGVVGALSILGNIASTVFNAISSVVRTIIGILWGLIKTIGNVIASMVKLGLAISASVVAGLISIATYSVKAADSLEKLQKQWKVAGGTPEGFKSLRTMASKNPNLTTKDAAPATTAFMRMGKSEEQAIKYTDILGNALAKFGQGSDAISNVLVQMEQLNGKTSGFTQDIRAIQNYLPDVTQNVTKAFGVKTLDDLSRKAGVTGAKIVDAIIRTYANLPRMEPGLSDMVNNIKEQLSEVAAIIGEPLLPLLKNVAKIVSDFLGDLIDNPDKVFQFVDKILSILVNVFNRVSAFIADLYNGVVKIINQNMKYVNYFINMLIAGAEVAVAAFRYLADNAVMLPTYIKNALDVIWQMVSPYVSDLSTNIMLLISVISALTRIGSIATAMLGMIIGIYTSLLVILTSVVRWFIALGSAVKNFGQALWDILKWVGNKLKFWDKDRNKKADNNIEDLGKRGEYLSTDLTHMFSPRSYLFNGLGEAFAETVGPYINNAGRGWDASNRLFNLAEAMYDEGAVGVIGHLANDIGNVLSEGYKKSMVPYYRPDYGRVSLTNIPEIQAPQIKTPTYSDMINSANGWLNNNFSDRLNEQQAAESATQTSLLTEIAENTRSMVSHATTQSNNAIPVRY